MLPFVFAGATVLCVAIVVMARVELSKGVRMGGNTRRIVERALIRVIRAFSDVGTRMSRFVHKDVFVKGLHGVSYLALLTVRYVEHKLVWLTDFFRSMRNKK